MPSSPRRSACTAADRLAPFVTVILINRGTFRGCAGVRELARMPAEELPEHAAFRYTHVAAEGPIAFLEWSYEDSTVRVRDGADSYVIENGKIVARTIHCTLEQELHLSCRSHFTTVTSWTVVLSGSVSYLRSFRADLDRSRGCGYCAQADRVLHGDVHMVSADEER